MTTELDHIGGTVQQLIDALPEDAIAAVIIYEQPDGGWTAAWSRMDTAEICFAAKILERTIFRWLDAAASHEGDDDELA